MKTIRGAILTIILTASLGRITYNNHIETWYSLPMTRIVQKADAYYGLNDVYAVREDGVKTYNGLVMLAADPSVPYGSLIETSLGTGIVLDRHTSKNKDAFDVATAWGNK